jgi:rfaE bifunctional protein nucleotidyltransferase chain/domain
VDFRDKIIPAERLPAWRETLAAAGRKLVVTNGCFDLLHLGHVTYLQAARALGDCLLVGVNSDASVRAIKGPERPLNPEDDRAAVLAALASVDAVSVFPEPDARAFLRRVRPDVYVKGGDYTLDTINQEERRLVESLGGRVVVLGGVPGRSTSELARRLARND